MVWPVQMLSISDGTVVLALLMAFIILAAVVLLLSVLSTERFLDDAAERSNLRLPPQVPLLIGEVTAEQARSIMSECRLDLARAVHLHGISDETPEPGPKRELKRRTRVLSLLHRVSNMSKTPVEPVVESRRPPTPSAVVRVNESRRRRLEELLRGLGEA